MFVRLSRCSGAQSDALNAEAAKDLAKYLMSPEAQAEFKAKRFDPA